MPLEKDVKEFANISFNLFIGFFCHSYKILFTYLNNYINKIYNTLLV